MSKLNQDDYQRNAALGLKIIGGMNTVIHCHHYNSRLQRTIEGNTKVDGQSIMRKSAALVYHELLTTLREEKKSGEDLTLAANLYKFLGFGTLDFSDIANGKVTSPNSHYVEGWQCGSVKTKGKVCRMTEGYIEGAIKAILGKDVSVLEQRCMNEDASHESCVFTIKDLDQPKYDYEIKRSRDITFAENIGTNEIESNIDKKTIIDTVINMPLEGNNEGLIPAFNVYLAHTPQDYYNLISINFVKEMEKVKLASIAKEMLVEDAENCALNTFGGILDSEEWAALIAPMVKEERDVMFGLNAVANALGWGRINIKEHTPYKSLELESTNGYEAFGYIEFEKYNNLPQCFMLKGVSAGLMGLVYEKGDLEDRAGTYSCEEVTCLTMQDSVCLFKTTVSDD